MVSRGLDSLVRDLLTKQSQEDQLPVKTLIAMARVNPDFVYGFLARATDLGSGMEDWWKSLIQTDQSQSD